MNPLMVTDSRDGPYGYKTFKKFRLHDHSDTQCCFYGTRPLIIGTQGNLVSANRMAYRKWNHKVIKIDGEYKWAPL